MYTRSLQGWLKHLDFIVLDELSLLLSLLLAVYWIDRPLHTPEYAYLSRSILIILIVNIFAVIVANTMDHVLHRGFYKEFAATVKHILILAVISAAIMRIRLETWTLSAGAVYAAALFYLVIAYTVRLAWKYYLRSHTRRQEAQLAVLIVTNMDSAPEILERMEAFSFERYRVAGLVIVDKDAKGERINGVPVVADLSDAADYLCREWIDEVFFFRASLDPRCSELIERCREMALTVHLYLAMQNIDEQKQTVERIAGYEVLTANINMMTPGDAFLKRAFDIAAGIFGSFAAVLVILIFGPFIYAASPGPLLFKQKRVGQNGQPFTMYKLRSMYLDAERRKAEFAAVNDHSDGMLFKMDFDPRVIGNCILPDGTKKKGIGDFIRSTSLDEFPQFFNVLKGEMSVVGTRPPTLDEWEKYQFHHRARMSIKPGLTGLWQIDPDKDTMLFDDVVRLDTEYISSWNVGQDLRIIVRTASKILRVILRG